MIPMVVPIVLGAAARAAAGLAGRGLLSGAMRGAATRATARYGGRQAARQLLVSIRRAEMLRDINETINRLRRVEGKVGRKACRRAAAKAGNYVLREAKKDAPKAETKLFQRSLMRKPYTRASRGVYMSIVGQRLSRAGGSDQGTSKAAQFSSRQVNKARGANRGISTGISGTGKAVPMHFTTRPIKPHYIEALRKPRLWWNRGPKNKPIGLHTALKVRHPGVPNSVDWLAQTKRRTAGKVHRIFWREVNAELNKLTSTAGN